MSHKRFTVAFQPGQRVRLTSPMVNEPYPVPVGTEGVVLEVNCLDNWAQVAVAWDNGSRLMACFPQDEICVVV